MGSKSEATLRLRADKAHSELFDLYSDLRAVERRIRVLGCRNVGGKSRVVRFLRLLCSCSSIQFADQHVFIVLHTAAEQVVS